MKLVIILLTATFLQAGAKGYAQRVTINVKNASIEQVFDSIQQQTGYDFFYNNAHLKDVKPVSLNFRNAELITVLEACFADQPLDYQIENMTILVRKKPAFIINKSMAEAAAEIQEREITGQVTNSRGEPLEGVTITVKGAPVASTTNTRGYYRIMVPQEGRVLVFTSVGYTALESPIGTSNTINVVLKEFISGMEGVVIVGFGTQKKVNLTGAVSVISGTELINKPVTGTVDALQGVIPGVVVTKSTGSPGQENYNIQIRGVTSATNNPVLILIDGIEGNINDVRPEDIESISVLKDAASAAIYGAKAAGGVVLITTKSGKSGKISIEFNSYYTLAKLGRTQDRLSSYQVGLMRNEAEVNSGGSAPLSNENLAKLKDPDILWDVDPANPNQFRYWGDYDYEKLVLTKFTPMMSHSLAISGGSEKTTFRISGTYFKNNGSIKIGPDSDTRYSARLNLNTQLNKYLELSNLISYSNNQVEKPWQGLDGDYGLWSYVYTYPGVTPLYDPNGHLAYGMRVGSFDGRIKFFQYDYAHGFKSWNKNNIRATSTLTIKNLVKNLQFRVVGAVDANFDKTFYQSKAIEYYGIDESVLGNLTGTNITKGQGNSATKEFQFLADYNFQIKDHSIALLGGYSFQDYRYSYFQGYIQDLVNENLPSFDWASLDNMTLSDDAASTRYQSIFGRLQYNYDDRYLFETNIRYDGSSKLSPKNRYQLFPSVSAAWRVSKENWFNTGFINELKLRGSFGQLGNANAIGNYDYTALLSTNNDLILGSDGGDEQRAQYIYQSQLASSNITWETVQTSNIGMDVSLLGNRLILEGNYYIKRNKNMLAAVAYPSVLGIGVGNQNVGELKTWGWEASLSWRERKKTFTYWVNLNIDDSQNELIEYYGATVIQSGTRKLLEAYPINSIFGYKTDGLFQSADEVGRHAFQNTLTGAGDVKYIDLNGDGQINSGNQTEADHGDLVYLGNTNPRYNFGLRGGFTWKGLDLSIFLQGTGKRTFLMNQVLLAPFSASWFAPQQHQLDYWTPENTDAYWPRLLSGRTYNYQPSDKWVQDAAYIRLKDIRIGYNIPNRLISRLGIAKLQFYAAGRDIWESTKTLKVIDPETPNQATFQYPFRRSYTIGLNLNF